MKKKYEKIQKKKNKIITIPLSFILKFTDPENEENVWERIIKIDDEYLAGKCQFLVPRIGEHICIDRKHAIVTNVSYHYSFDFAPCIIIYGDIDIENPIAYKNSIILGVEHDVWKKVE